MHPFKLQTDYSARKGEKIINSEESDWKYVRVELMRVLSLGQGQQLTKEMTICEIHGVSYSPWSIEELGTLTMFHFHTKICGLSHDA